MKVYHFLYLATFVFGLQACQSTDDRKDRDNEATTAVDSLSDTTQRAQAYTSDVALTGDEKSFILPAAVGGMMEVEAANVILLKSGNKAVKEFAALMVKDHTKANKDLATVAQGKGIAIPTALPEEMANHIKKMQELSGRSLDVHYITMMVNEHANTVALFEQAARYEDPALKSFVVQTLPILQVHNKKAIKLGKDLNITNAGNGDDFPNVRPDTLKK